MALFIFILQIIDILRMYRRIHKHCIKVISPLKGAICACKWLINGNVFKIISFSAPICVSR